MRCAACNYEIGDGARFCASCGAAVGSPSQMPTATARAGAAEAAAPAQTLRVGLLAAMTAFYVSGLFILFPVTARLSAWYAGSGVTAVLVLAALALFGFTTSLAGRSALGTTAFEN